MLNAQGLDRLFKQYGFTLSKSNDQCRVYVRAAGYFHNAEVVPIDDTAQVDSIVREFQASGFSTKVSRFRSLEEADQQLFRGFFQHEATATRLRREYNDFCQKNTATLGSPYNYVQSPYLLDGQRPRNGEQITDAIFQCLSDDKPSMVFLEAAAGFGKTCTSYELLRLFLDQHTEKNPILAELQRNRQARIFRYVLYDEMDRNFQACGLSAEMVQREIKSGRIPLIIDGFDELLHLDREGHSEKEFVDVEPMLRTLSELLESRAKLLVTTRRTAILGEKFDEWLAALLDRNASVHRFTLLEPQIGDWIGLRRQKQLEENGIPLQSMANPVLLAYLRSLNDQEFDCICHQGCQLVDTYFERLLSREQKRQELPLAPEKQLGILKTLAKKMLDEGSSFLSREEIKKVVLHEHYAWLKDALRSASEIAARTPEELADKLTDHALLDQKASTNGGIGFVNDFIHGTIIGMAMLDAPTNLWFDEPEMDKAVTAFRFRGEEDRTALWNTLFEPAQVLDETWQVGFDLQLLGRLARSLDNCEVHDTCFRDISVGSDNDLRDVVFIRCAFSNVKFDAGRMTRVGFVNCSFTKCELSGSLADGDCWFGLDCQEFGGTVIETSRPQPAQDDVLPAAGTDFEQLVLSQFWPIGRPFARPVLQVRTLYQGTAGTDRARVTQAIEGLRAKGLIQIQDRLARLNFERMTDVRTILGR